MNAICIVIDRLHVGYLGCYGNSWIATPSFDSLAADGFLFDQALIDSPDLAVQYESFVSGRHTLSCAAGLRADRQVSFEQLAAAGVRTTLITDDPAVAHLPWANGLDEVIHVESRHVKRPAAELEETNLARFFAVVGEWLDAAEEPFCLWAHTAGLASCWDCAFEPAARYADQDEAAPPDDAIVPSRRLAQNYDPDELLGLCQAYAGQVSLLDLCVGALAEDVAQSRVQKNTLLSMLSARGFPLGEHGRVGAFDNALYAELVSVPWILCFPDGCGAGDRTQSLVQLRDLAPTLRDWFGLLTADHRDADRSLLALARGETGAPFDRAIVIGADDSMAIRVPAWYLLKAPGSPEVLAGQHGPTAELFAKPDDRWEVNDVASRCPDVVELLSQILADDLRGEVQSRPAPLPPILLAGLD